MTLVDSKGTFQRYVLGRVVTLAKIQVPKDFVHSVEIYLRLK